MGEDNQNLAEILQHRAVIDALDKQIVSLLNERQTHALAIRQLKPGAQMGLFDPKREEEIIDGLQEYNQGPLYPDNLREIYTAILKVSKEVPA